MSVIFPNTVNKTPIALKIKTQYSQFLLFYRRAHRVLNKVLLRVFLFPLITTECYNLRMTKTDKTERREHPRLNFGFQIYEQDFLFGFAHNISATGCYIETENINRDIFDIFFELPGTLEKMEVRCSTVWSEANKGIGVKFLLNGKNKKILSRFIEDFQ